MSIFAYVGLPGSGKTYSVVEHQILPALRMQRVVCTNVPMKWDLVKAEVGGDLRQFPMEAVRANPEVIMEAVPPGAILVLDEVWRIFPAGLKANQVPEAFRSVFAEHRHRVNAAGQSTQIVLVTQDLAQISAFARQLVEQTFRTVKLTSLGLQSRFRVDVYAGPVTGPNPPINTRLREIFGRYDKRIFRLYESHTQSEAGTDGADEKAVDRRGNVLLRPLMIAAPVIMLVLGWFGVSTLMKDHHKLQAPAASAAAGGRSAPAGPQSLGPLHPGELVQPRPSPASSSAPQQSWRVLGFVENLDAPQRSVALLASGEGRRIVQPLSSCQRAAGEPIQCELEGTTYTATGRVLGGVAKAVGEYVFGR